MDNAAFWDKIAPKYAKDPISNKAAYDYTLGRTRSFLGAGDRVLELGCGTGSTALLLADVVGHYTATDLSRGMIDIAKAKPTDLTNLDFHVSDGVPEGATYDAVLAFNLLHLVPDWQGLIAQIHASLPAGGLFIQKTACLDQGLKWRLISYIVPVMQMLGKAPHLSKINPVQLEKVVTAAGFDIVESGDYALPARYIVARKR